VLVYAVFAGLNGLMLLIALGAEWLRSGRWWNSPEVVWGWFEAPAFAVSLCVAA
jgi:hypothetical protein